LGDSAAFQEAFDAIVRAVKDTIPQSWSHESPLVLVGHSMGALIAQTCVRRLLALEAARDELVQADVATTPQTDGTLHAETRSRHGRFAFPDLVITLNSAANAWIARDIRNLLITLKMRREPTDGRVGYLAPIVISATGRSDWITRYVWRVANWPQKTDGHSDDLHSHDVREFGPAHCAPGVSRRSFGQAWHCLRCPEPISHDTPTFRIDLPARPDLDSKAGNRAWQHVRYVLSPRPDQARERSPFWIFLLPRAISRGHNDIFNYRLSLLILALMQISGAAVSLATKWSEVFEPETADEGHGS
jgi:pimeloyl-ACP methyl ester carboxylesterase